MSPRLLDLFCGAGGAAMGYHRAGFDVVGVDIEPQPDYPFHLTQGDVLALDPGWVGTFDAVHASPPCQAYSTPVLQANRQSEHPDLVADTRCLLERSGVPWVMENVPPAPMRRDLLLCGSMFDLTVEWDGEVFELRRHRIFEMGGWFPMGAPECRHRHRVMGIYGDISKSPRGARCREGRVRPDVKAGRGQARELMGMPWVSEIRGVVEAIPPAYTEWIGGRLMEALG
jgi:DNA (cytosine-5)-methyltransferase 1